MDMRMNLYVYIQHVNYRSDGTKYVITFYVHTRFGIELKNQLLPLDECCARFNYFFGDNVRFDYSTICIIFFFNITIVFMHMQSFADFPTK